MGYVPQFIDTGGMLTFSWIIPYSFLLLILFVIYYRFLANLPARTRLLFILAAIVFITGALGLEMLGGQHVSVYGFGSKEFELVYVTIEESLEMAGLTILIYALCSYICNELKIKELRF